MNTKIAASRAVSPVHLNRRYSLNMIAKPRTLGQRRLQFRELAPTAVGSHSKAPTPEPDNKERISWPMTFHDRYDLGRELGRGSHGVVRVCTDKITGLDYAVKMVPKKRRPGATDGSDVPAMRTLPHQKLRQEAAYLQTVQGSPYAVRLVGLYEDDSYAFIVQELCLGGSLASYLSQEGYFRETEAARALYCILSFVAECHANNILYGDVKLANFIVAHPISDAENAVDGVPHAKTPWIKAIDLGCASCCPPGFTLSKVKGTPLYAAPETFLKSFDKASDMWGIGIIMYQLLCGQLPFWEKSSGLGMFELMEGTLGGSVLWKPDSVWEDVSPEARDLISRLLDRDPTARITADAALEHPWMRNCIPCGPACLLECTAPWV